jgi:hypothetical protein
MQIGTGQSRSSSPRAHPRHAQNAQISISGSAALRSTLAPPPEVAAWAGHSVEVLMRVYARCMTGLQDVWITRMDQSLRLGDPPGGGSHDGPGAR